MTAATTTSTTTQASPYRMYWVAWLILLIITLAMVFIRSTPVLLAGIMVKATIITMFFMHLLHERRSFIWIVTLSMLLTCIILFALIAPDGKAM